MPHLEWYHDLRTFNRILVRRPGVATATMFHAQLIASGAQSILAAHHANNADDPRPDSYVDTSRGTVDAFVNLNDPDGGALPIAWFLGVLAPYAFGGKGPQPKAPSGWYKDVVEGKKRKKLGKGYGKKR